MRKLVLAAVVALIALVAAKPGEAQTPPPVIKVGVTTPAKQYLDSIANEARAKNHETAGCVTHYAVEGDSLFIEGLVGAHYTKSDSANIYSDGKPLCPEGVPTIHTHRYPLTYPEPSGIDLATTARVGVWAMILVVSDASWRIIVY